MRRLLYQLHHSEVDTHRDFDCRYYERCLTYAMKMKWESFSCKDCEMRQSIEWREPEDLTQE